MLLTVTSNPSVDRILHVPHLTTGEVHRATSLQLAAAGKGLNVTRTAHIVGCDVVATGPLAGRNGQLLNDLVQTEGFTSNWFQLKNGETRSCTLITHDTNDTTVINELGPTIAPQDWAAFATHVQQLAQNAEAVVFSGSVPPGVDPQMFAQLTRSVATDSRAVYVDTSNAPLAAVLANPFGLCVKVNQHELAVGLEFDLGNQPPQKQLIEAGHSLLERGASLVVITLGRDGALAISRAGSWHAAPPAIELISTVGSGDAMAAGFAVARLQNRSLADSLVFAVSCGSANALNNMPGRVDLQQLDTVQDQVQIKQVV